MMRVVVTGATGFVGGFVRRALEARGARVFAVGRALGAPHGSPEMEGRLLPDSPPEHMCAALEGANAVVHLAAAVHDIHGRTTPAVYLQANREYPLRLAEAAARAGVTRFVFTSTIKVNGESTPPGEAFGESSQPSPRGPYAESKWHAEKGLQMLSAQRGIQTRIVRPPLVYGAGVRANFLSLMRWVRKGIPLPFAGFDNQRSLIYVENLADVLARLAMGSGDTTPSRTYLVCDGEDLSTRDLVRRIAFALGVTPRLFRVPESILRYGLAVLHQRDVLDRLAGSLCVDAALVRRELDWTPPFSVDTGLARTAAWFNGPS
jgi:nucleoside-diphosphate-sugar epimerase